jgi:hypothetical protein
MDLSEIVLNRFCYHPQGTLGKIELEDEVFWTIERPWLDNRPNVSCIPIGLYPMERRVSPRFGETWYMPDVPDRTWILMHVANFPKDVQGCIGIGMGLMGDRIAVADSRKALEIFERMTVGKEWLLRVSNAQYAALPSS